MYKWKLLLFEGMLFALLLLTPGLFGQSARDNGLTGWDYFYQKRYDKALVLLEKDWKNYPFSSVVIDGVGWCQYFLGDLNAAEDTFRKALLKNPTYRFSEMGLKCAAEARVGPITEAESLITQKRYQEAADAFEDLLPLFSVLPRKLGLRVLVGCGYAIYYSSNDPIRLQFALNLFQEAARFDRSSRESHVGVGYIQFKRKKYKYAEDAINKAFELSLDNLQLRLTYGWCAFYRKNIPAAVKRFEETLKKYPSSFGALIGLAWCNDKMKKEKEAIQLFRKSIRLSPQAATPDLLAWIKMKSSRKSLYIDYAFSLIETENYLSAIELLESVQPSEDKGSVLLGQALVALNSDKPSSAYMLARELLEKGYAAGRDINVFVVTSTKSNYEKIQVSARSILGWTQLKLGLIEEAALSFEKALLSTPDEPYVKTGMGFVRLAQARHNEARGCFLKALELLPGYDPAAAGLKKVNEWRFEEYTRGWTILDAGDLKLAKKIFTRVRADNSGRFPPDRIDLIEYSIGHIARLNGNAEEAAARFKAALLGNPNFYEAQVGLGWALLEMEKHKDALAPLESSIALSPLDPAPRTLLIRALIENEQKSKACDRVMEWVGKFPFNAELGELSGRLLLERGYVVEARIAFQSMISHDPDRIPFNEFQVWMKKHKAFYPIVGVFGWALYNNGRYVDAQQRFKEAFKLEPGDLTHQKGLAFCCSRLGKFGEAEKHAKVYFSNLGESNKDSAELRRSSMTLAWDLFNAGEYKDAIKRFKEIVLHDAKNNKKKSEVRADVQCAMGFAWLRLDKPERAKDCFLEAIGQDPKYESAITGLEEVKAMQSK